MVGACQPRYNQPLRRNHPTDKASGRCSLPTSRRYFGSTPPKQWMAQRRGTHEMAQFAVNVMCPSERGPPTVTGLFSSSATKRPATQNYDFVPGNKIVEDPRGHAAEVQKSPHVAFK